MQFKNSIIVIILLIGLVVIPNNDANVHPLSMRFTISIDGKNHPPIMIEGNDNFTSENGVTGGSGTEADPYILENWIIVGDGSISTGIVVNNTDVYFIIRNCTIYNFDLWNYCGLIFNNVTNGIIDNISLYENCYGAFIIDSSYIEINQCLCYSIEYQGLALSNSSSIRISSCECYNVINSYSIYLSDSADIVVEDTFLHDNFKGLGISESYDTQNPITNITIVDCIFKNHSWDGILFSSRNRHPSHSVVRDCKFYNNGWTGTRCGISIERLSHNIIENCTFFQNRIGIGVSTKANIIRNCSIYNNRDGIQISGWLIAIPPETIPNNKVIHCDIYNNTIGILQVTSFRTHIEKNNINNNSWIGLYIFPSCTGELNFNNIHGNGYAEDVQLPCGLYCGRSIIDARYNWWGSENGPRMYKYGFLGIIPIRFVGSEKIIRSRSIIIYRPWVKEPIPDAGVR